LMFFFLQIEHVSSWLLALEKLAACFKEGLNR